MTVNVAMLAPAAVLVAWSLVVLVWMTITRFAGMAKIGANLKEAKPGGRGQDLEALLPPQTVWKAHNFTHLMESPTMFYPLVVILALTGAGETQVLVAWAYVAIRVIHSLWQALVNTIPVRVALFALSTVCLIVLAISAVQATL